MVRCEPAWPPLGSGPEAPGGGGAALKARHSRQQRASLVLGLSAGPHSPWPRGNRRQSWRPCGRKTTYGVRTSAAMSLGDRASFGPPLHFRQSFRFRRRPGEAALPLVSVVMRFLLRLSRSLGSCTASGRRRVVRDVGSGPWEEGASGYRAGHRRAGRWG